MSRGLTILAAAALVALGCAKPAPQHGHLKITGTPGDARVIVDDKDAADLRVVAKYGLKLPPGKHRITVERAGYFPWDGEVEVKGTEPVVIGVALTKIPD